MVQNDHCVGLYQANLMPFLTILGEGALLFLVLLIGAGPCVSAGSISTKRYIAFCVNISWMLKNSVIGSLF